MKPLSMALLFSGACFAGVIIPPNQPNDDYSPQNNGKTGLIETPNARVLDDWRIRPNLYFSDPFVYYGLTIAPLPRLEVNFRVTQVRGVPGFGDAASYGDYKDKAIDLKFLLVKEDDFWPAIAIGADDIHGTGLYSSKYLVGTKRWKWLEVSGGYALGRLGGENLSLYAPNETADRGMSFLTSTKFGGGSPFGGFEAHLTPDLSLKAEYSPIEYRYDHVNPFTRGVSAMPESKVNVGVRYKLTDKIALSANFERGNVFGVGLNMTIPFRSQGLYDHDPDPKWRGDPAKKETIEHYPDRELADYIANEIAAERFSNIQVAVNENKIWASLENPRYNSNMKALGRAADVIDEVAPDRIDEFYLALKKTNLEYSVVHLYREDVKSVKQDEQLPLGDTALSFSDDTQKSYREFAGDKEIVLPESIGGEKFSWLFKPSLQTYLNNKEDPFVYKFSVLGGVRYETFPGGFFFNRYRFPISNTTDSINPLVLEPESTVTRSDVAKYTQYNGVQLQDMVYDQTIKLPWNVYGRTEIGYFEPAYGGIDVELYRPFDGGRFGIGVEYQYTRKRKVDEFFGFERATFEGKFVNLFANLVPHMGIKTSAKIGEFFAGDRGVSLTLSRQFRDFTIGAFVTKTDTSMFRSPENRNYMDKGVFLTIPISVLSPKNVKGSLSYGLRPWTRDVGQYASQANSLVGLDPANVYEMRHDADSFKE